MVVEKVVGYKKIKFQTHENAGYGDVRLPEMQMHTTAFWLRMGESAKSIPASLRVDGLRGLGIALETVAAFRLMCDPRDLGIALDDPRRDKANEDDDEPTLFLYEHVPGGTGLAERIFALRDELFAGAKRLIESCACKAGCPACVGPADTSGNRKRVAVELLDLLV